MAVNKHPTLENTWIIDYRPDGRKGRRVRETYIGTYDDAIKRWTELCQRHASLNKSKTNPRLNDVIPDYLAHIELNKSDGYHKTWVWALAKIKPHFGAYPVSQITEQLIEDFKRKHRSTPSHCNLCLRYLKILITWMVSKGKAQPLPFKIIRLPHVEALPQPPSPREYDKILETIRENFKKSGTCKEGRALKEAMVHTIYVTGLRFKEAVNLQWNNLRWEDGRILVGITKTKVPRYATLPPEALELLKPYKKKAGYIFTNPDTSKPYTTIRNLLKNAAKKHGIHMKGPHDLRDAAATDTLEATGDIRAAQTLLGHANIKSTIKYTHVSVKRQQRVAAQTAEFRRQERKNQD